MKGILKHNIDIIIAGTTGFVIILLLCRHGGIGISPDSVIYMSAANNLRAHGVLQDYNQWPLVDFPSFYPLFLSAVMFVTGSTLLAVAPVLNALLFALVIFCSGRIMQCFSFPSAWYRRLLLSCIVISPALLEIYSMLWSETLFILFVLLFIRSLYNYLRNPSVKLLLITGFVAGIACVTRYAGITLLCTGGLLLLSNHTLAWRKKIIHLFLFGITGCSLLIINLLRNNYVTHTLTGYREPANSSLAKNMRDSGAVFGDWLPFLHNHQLTATIIAGCIAIVLGIAWIRHSLANKKYFSCEQVAITFFLVYIVFIIGMATVSRFQPLDNRLLSPLYIPFLWGISSWITSIVKSQKSVQKKWLIAGGLLLFTCFQFNQVGQLNEMWDGIKDAGIPGYTEDQWRYSPTVSFIQKNKALFSSDYTIYSNASDAVYFFTGMKAELLPHKDFVSDIEEFVKDDTCYVIWFNDGYNPDLVSLAFIAHAKKMKMVRQFEDGAVYSTEESNTSLMADGNSPHHY